MGLGGSVPLLFLFFFFFVFTVVCCRLCRWAWVPRFRLCRDKGYCCKWFDEMCIRFERRFPLTYDGSRVAPIADPSAAPGRNQGSETRPVPRRVILAENARRDQATRAEVCLP